MRSRLRSIDARAASRVVVGPSCWEWQGAVNRQGYGVISFRAAGSRLAHRYVLEQLVGPTDSMLCHTCDNPACVNPAHLYEGTALTNAQDRDRRRRRRVRDGDLHAPHADELTR